MTISETEQKIFDSDKFVISELKKVQTLYKLKEEILYNHERIHEPHTESVAEHTYAMQCIADYFLPLEDPEEKWDHGKIHMMIPYHDIDEIETGDMPSHWKSAKNIQDEKAAGEIVIERLPEIMQARIRELYIEYEERETPEAKFVKAIDKIEPIFHLYNENGKNTFKEVKGTKDTHDSLKYPHIRDFPTIKRFCDVMSNAFEKEGFFYTES